MPRGELSGLKVLVTRPAHQAGPLCELISQAGGEAVRFPVLAVEAAEAFDDVRRLLEHLNDYWLAIFISPNAVRFGIEAAARHGGIPATLQLAAVGEGSRRELELQLGRQVDLVPQERFDSEGLLALPALQEVSGKKIIIFRGSGGRELLAQTLRERGAQVDYAEVYRRTQVTAPDPATLNHWINGGVNAITVTSSEGLQNLYGMMEERGRDWLLGVPLFVVSERCAALAQQLGFRLKAHIAHHASDEAILESLVGWARHNTGHVPENEKIMSETENKQQSSPLEQAGSVNNKRIAVIAVAMSLLVALLAVALWFEVRKIRAQTQAIETQVEANVVALAKSEREQRSALSAEGRERDQKLAERQESIEQGMQAIRDQLGRDHHEWMVAESDYLLRFAHRRLLLERDVRGALIALRSVDQLLADGANPLYLPVREQLRGEIQSLEAITQVDVDGIALELSGLSKQVDALPLTTARRDLAKAQVVEAEQAADEGTVVGRFFAAMWREVKSLVIVRRLDQKVMPLLPPEQRYFLAQNLRLRMELASLALLRGDAAVYQESLTVAAGWLVEYYDNNDAAVKYSRDTLARLAQVNIAPALPEIGGSLRTLERIYEKQTGRKPAAATRGRQP